MTITAISTTPPQRWHCDLCGYRYTHPFPLRHPPTHSCRPPGGPRRHRNLTPDTETEC